MKRKESEPVKYYDDVNLYPSDHYLKNNGEITKIKTIRLSQEEEANWDSKEIHEFLSGDKQPNDSIRINTLKDYLKGLYDIMEKKMNPKNALEPNEMELLLIIEEVIDHE